MTKNPVLKLHELEQYGYTLRLPPPARLVILGKLIKNKYPPLSIVHNLDKLAYTFKDVYPWMSEMYNEDKIYVVQKYLMEENKVAKRYGFPYDWLYEEIMYLSKDEDYLDSFVADNSLICFDKITSKKYRVKTMNYDKKKLNQMRKMLLSKKFKTLSGLHHSRIKKLVDILDRYIKDQY